jgi:hypothetical protein
MPPSLIFALPFRGTPVLIFPAALPEHSGEREQAEMSLEEYLWYP